VMPRIQPVERFRIERDGGKGRRRYARAAAHNPPGCQPESTACFLRASAAERRLRGGGVAREHVYNVSELPNERFGNQVSSGR
jgi:hypothetical protein